MNPAAKSGPRTGVRIAGRRLGAGDGSSAVDSRVSERRRNLGWLPAPGLALAALLLFANCGDPQSEPAAPPQPTPIPDVVAAASAAATSTAPVADTASRIDADDGSAELQIQPGALPAEFDISGIDIARVEPTEDELLFDDGPPIAAYELRPAGLQFAEPVRLTLTLPYEGSAAPLMVQISGDQVEIVPVVEFRPGETAGQSIVIVEIQHFSRLVSYAPRMFR